MSKTPNQERIERMEQVADGGDVNRKDDLVDLEDEDTAPAVESPPVEKPPEERKLKLKVNGEDREMTEAEVVAIAQKNIAADQRLQSAAEALRLSAEKALSEKPDVPSEEDIALARALQMGSEEDAVKAIRTLRQPLSKTPDVAKQVDERVTVLRQRDEFEHEFKDVLGDKTARELIYARDAQLAQASPDMSYLDRWKKAATEVRAIKGVANPRAEILAKKDSQPSIQAAGARATPPVEEEGEEDPQLVIDSMAKARHQERPFR